MSELTLLLKATDFAAKAHKDQRRKNAEKTPYINHPIGVTNTLIKCGYYDVEALMAAMLHDTVEDTDVEFEDLIATFGEKVTNYVKEVSDNKELPKADRKRLQVEHALHATPQAKMVKMADKEYNCRSLLKSPPTWWDAKRIQGYMVWSKKVTDNCRESQEPIDYKPKNPNPMGPTPNIRLGWLLDEVWGSTFEYKDEVFPAIPVLDDEELEQFLEDYYIDMEEAGKTELD